MADRSITLRLGANVDGLVNGLKTAARATEDAAKRTDQWIAKNKTHLNELSSGFTRAGLVLTAFAALSVVKAAQFDKAMSSVQAATMETASNMAVLREAAIQAGADTQYSATEAANAIEELAKAGVSTADILGGALSGALNLAAAGQLDVAQAAEIAATAMTQFNLKGRDVTHLSDLLAAGAGKAQGDVTDLSMALKQSGLVAAQMGLSVEETTGTLTAFASAGLLGSDAGTSFRTMLLRLANPTKESAALMEDLGIKAYDANGNFAGMASIAGQLDKALKPLPQSQRDAASATIFGSDAIRAANVLYAEGERGIRKWTAAVDDQGYAAEQARIKTDNLLGDVERLSGSLDTVFIKSGSGANDVLRNMAQGAESVVDRLGELDEGVLSTTTLIAGAGGLAALGVGGLLKLTTGINDAKTALAGLNISLKSAGIVAGALGGALVVGTLAFAQWAQKAAEARARAEEFQSTLDGMGNVTSSTMRTINQALSESKGGNAFTKLFGGPESRSAIDMASRMGIEIQDLQGFIVGQRDAIERVHAAQKAYTEDGLVKGTEAYRSNQFEVENLNQRLAEQGQALTTAQRAQVQKSLADEAAGVTSEEATTSLQKYVAAQESGTETTEDYTNALKELVDQQREAAGIALGLRDAQRNYEQAIADATQALKDNGVTLDITTEKGRANQAALDDVASSGWDVVDSMRENGATQEELQGTMQTTRDRFLAVATQMGLSADEANRLADQLGLIPSNVSVTVAANTEAAQQKVDAFVAALNQRVATINVRAALPDLNGSASGSGRMGSYDSGGYTGAGGKYEPAGVVHRGEFVMPADITSRLRPAFESIYRTGRLPNYDKGGFVTRAYGGPFQASAPAQSSGAATPSLSIGQIVAADPHEAVKEMRAAWRMELAGRRM